MMDLPKLRIEGDGPTAQQLRVALDDYDLTPNLRSLTLDLAVDSVNTVILTVAVGEVDVSAEALVALHAHDDGPDLDEKLLAALRRLVRVEFGGDIREVLDR